MSRWGTILLLLVTTVVAAFLFFIEPDMQASRTTASTTDHLVDVDIMAIRGLRMQSGSEVVELIRNPEGWLVGPTPTDHADGKRVAEILSALADTKIYDRISASEIRSSKDLRRYGLEDPRSKLEILSEPPIKINFGREAVGDNRVYVQIEGNHSVFVVSNEIQTAAFQKWQSFRDRRLTRFSTPEIDRFTIRRPNGELDIERTPVGWRLTRPMQADGDDENIAALINSILGAQIVEFSDPQAAGGPLMDSTSTEVLFYPDDRDEPGRLVITGAELVNDTPMVRVEYPERNATFYLFPEILRLTKTAPDEIRDRRLLRMNLDAVDSIRVVLDDDTTVRWIRGSDGWIGEPGGAVASTVSVEALVDTLNGSRVKSYTLATPDALAKAKLAPPSAEVFFDAWVSENTPEAVAGRYPVAKLEIGGIQDGLADVRPSDGPEICQIDAQPLLRFMQWAKATTVKDESNAP